MSKLTIARKVAVHPSMITLMRKRQMMWKRLRNDYGRDFMGLDFMTLPTDAKERSKVEAEEFERAQEGVNRWTRPERAAYFALEERIGKLRDALTNHYGQTA